MDDKTIAEEHKSQSDLITERKLLDLTKEEALTDIAVRLREAKVCGQAHGLAFLAYLVRMAEMEAERLKDEANKDL